MEPLRPVVDKFVLDLLAARELEQGDVVETREGVCRLGPELARELAAVASHLRSGLAPELRPVRSGLLAGGSGAPNNMPNASPQAITEHEAITASNGAERTQLKSRTSTRDGVRRQAQAGREGLRRSVGRRA